ncbi:MAG: metallophosphoesterase [Ardenticatenaceae bacterium]|nr:metallophosphoesterase [Ardenticatenaceae bacterium]
MTTKPLRVLHFADAHIDIANYGRHDPETGLPLRVVDFLRALDQIVETAVSQQVDLVIFAGDAYKDRNPQPTFQRSNNVPDEVNIHQSQQRCEEKWVSFSGGGQTDRPSVVSCCPPSHMGNDRTTARRAKGSTHPRRERLAPGGCRCARP